MPNQSTKLIHDHYKVSIKVSSLPNVVQRWVASLAEVVNAKKRTGHVVPRPMLAHSSARQTIFSLQHLCAPQDPDGLRTSISWDCSADDSAEWAKERLSMSDRESVHAIVWFGGIAIGMTWCSLNIITSSGNGNYMKRWRFIRRQTAMRKRLLSRFLSWTYQGSWWAAHDLHHVLVRLTRTHHPLDEVIWYSWDKLVAYSVPGLALCQTLLDNTGYMSMSDEDPQRMPFVSDYYIPTPCPVSSFFFSHLFIAIHFQQRHTFVSLQGVSTLSMLWLRHDRALLTYLIPGFTAQRQGHLRSHRPAGRCRH